VRFGDVCQIIARQVDPKVKEFGDLPHVNGENIEGGRCRLLYLRTAKEEGMISGKYLFEPGNVLYSKLRPYLRKAVAVDFRGVCSADMYPIQVDRDYLDPHFAAWLLVSDEFTNYADEQSRRARMPKLNREQLFAWIAPLPPLIEQQRISTILLDLMAAVERAQAAAESRLQAVQSLRAAYLRTVFDSPEAQTWPRQRLGELLQGIVAGISLTCEERPARLSEWGVLKVSAVTWGEFRGEENKVLPDGFDVPPECEVQLGDVLISRSNTTDLVGATVHVKQTRPRLMLSDKTLRLRPREEKIDKSFLTLALRSPIARDYIAGNATGTSPSMKNISQETIRKIPIVVPSLGIQWKIVEDMNHRTVAVAQLQVGLGGECAAIAALPGALLRSAFAGEL
jgi:type I restriction enzyme S subunit